MWPTHFSASSYRFREIKNLIFYLRKVYQGHEEQFLHLHHSIANVTIYTFLSYIFVLARSVSEI